MFWRFLLVLNYILTILLFVLLSSFSLLFILLILLFFFFLLLLLLLLPLQPSPPPPIPTTNYYHFHHHENQHHCTTTPVATIVFTLFIFCVSPFCPCRLFFIISFYSPPLLRSLRFICASVLHPFPNSAMRDFFTEWLVFLVGMVISQQACHPPSFREYFMKIQSVISTKSPAGLKRRDGDCPCIRILFFKQSIGIITLLNLTE